MKHSRSMSKLFPSKRPGIPSFNAKMIPHHKRTNCMTISSDNIHNIDDNPTKVEFEGLNREFKNKNGSSIASNTDKKNNKLIKSNHTIIEGGVEYSMNFSNDSLKESCMYKSEDGSSYNNSDGSDFKDIVNQNSD
eukprot:Pgem_evm1s11636